VSACDLCGRPPFTAASPSGSRTKGCAGIVLRSLKVREGHRPERRARCARWPFARHTPLTNGTPRNVSLRQDLRRNIEQPLSHAERAKTAEESDRSFYLQTRPSEGPLCVLCELCGRPPFTASRFAVPGPSGSRTKGCAGIVLRSLKGREGHRPEQRALRETAVRTTHNAHERNATKRFATTRLEEEDRATPVSRRARQDRRGV